MARIPDEELQRIKSQVTVEDLCRDYGIELRRTGPDNLMGLCPFHDDQTPSFCPSSVWVKPATTLYPSGGGASCLVG
jgi:hypothetical protein